MKIAIIGCGKMGLIYARSFRNFHLASNEELVLVEKNETRAQLLTEQGFRVQTLSEPALAESEVVILAIKPQDLPQLAPVLKPVLQPHQLVISILAGVKLQTLEHMLGHRLVVRAMPNTPAAVGKGITGIVFSEGIPTRWVGVVSTLLGTSGQTVIFGSDSDLDSVTALSGSGPAYVFYFMKAFVEAGQRLGLPPEQVRHLVRHTLIGSAELVNQATSSFDDMIEAVASRGGTTEAALKTFDAHGVFEGLVRGIEAAHRRAVELSDEVSRKLTE
jgi:pyrroline-5-carboxylate reductase